MAKIQIKSEKLTPFEEYFLAMAELKYILIVINRFLSFIL